VVAVERMVASALARIEDADLLQGTTNTQADSGYLLRLLAFEILLKAEPARVQSPERRRPRAACGAWRRREIWGLHPTSHHEAPPLDARP